MLRNPFQSKKSTVALWLLVLLLAGGSTMQAFAHRHEHEERGEKHERWSEKHEERGEKHERWSEKHEERGEKHERRGEKHASSKGSRFNATNATFQAECSACHMAYPPGLLPAASWQEMMGTLDKHFGTDASLDAATVAEILPFLQENAATGRKAESSTPPVLRITETRWFVRKHDEISPATWKRESIKSASNCMACHTTADKGDFDEDNVRIPK